MSVGVHSFTQPLTISLLNQQHKKVSYFQDVDLDCSDRFVDVCVCDKAKESTKMKVNSVNDWVKSNWHKPKIKQQLFCCLIVDESVKFGHKVINLSDTFRKFK